jgi:hypothetical protein
VLYVLLFGFLCVHREILENEKYFLSQNELKTKLPYTNPERKKNQQNPKSSEKNSYKIINTQI